jgi:hypothetical protein
LLEDFSKKAGKEAWKGRAGITGLVIGSAAMLAEYLQTKPFRQEGYYDGDHKLVLNRKIDTRNRKDYDPRQNPGD